jgi:hypothetical protein
VHAAAGGTAAAIVNCVAGAAGARAPQLVVVGILVPIIARGRGVTAVLQAVVAPAAAAMPLQALRGALPVL